MDGPANKIQAGSFLGSGEMNIKKIFSLMTSLAILTSSVMSAHAAEVTSSGEESSVPVTLTVSQAQFNVTLPTGLPVHVATDGTVTTADNVSIANNSVAPIEVKEVSVETANGWTLDNFASDFTRKKVGTKEFGMQMQNSNVGANGSYDASALGVIGGNSQLPLIYDAKVAAQKNAVSDETMANVVFTVAWTDKEPTEQPEQPDPSGTKHTITIKTEGVEHGIINGSSSLQTDDSGKITKLPETTPDEGYELDKWIDTNTGNTVNIGDSLSGDVTITPVFREKGNTHTVTIQTEGIEHGTVNALTPVKTDSSGKITSLPEATPDPGYVFDGWKDNEGNTYNEGDTIDKDVTLTPVFAPAGEPYKLTSDDKDMLLSNYMDESGVLDIPATIEKNGTRYKVTEIDGEQFNGEGYVGIFSSNTAIKSVKLPSTLSKIGSRAFNFCTNITSVTIPDSVTAIGDGAFEGCTGLGGITIPNSVTDMGRGVFIGCSGLTDVTIPYGLTAINTCTFQGCTGLTSVTIPDSVTTIKMSAFNECTNLRNITIPNSVTSIEDAAFEYCEGLESITIPDGVNSIGSAAFNGVKHIEYHGSLAVPENHWGALAAN